MVPTVLVVDDTEAGRLAMRKALEQSELDVNVLEAQDGAEALPLALGGEVDIVISDIVMPNLDGIGLLRGIRAQKDSDALPVILVTSQSDQERREQSFVAGASDYVTRPFSSSELVGRVLVQLRLRQLQDELRRANERHRRLGSHDELTKLANRRHLLESARRELARSRRHGFSMSISVVDIDGFRKVNAAVGHLVGDAIITDMAEVLTRDIRAADVIARIGGGKFAALLPQTDEEQVRVVGERWVESCAAHHFPGHEPGQLTVSVSSATYPGGGLESVDELVNAAESALQAAKDRGGGNYQAWQEPSPEAE